MDEQTIPARGHNFTSRKKSATEKGVTECFCENCGQTILVKSAFKKNKKKIIAWVSVLAALALIIALVPVFFSSFCHYAAGKVLTGLGMYEQAYYQFKECEDYKDTEKILTHFRLICGETIRTLYDGDSYTYEEEEYDPELNEVVRTCYRDNGEMSSRYTYCYDGNGDMILDSYEYYNEEGNLGAGHKRKYTLDEDGNCIRFVEYDSEGEKNAESKYTYDEDGNRIRSVSYGSNGIKNGEEKYTYDENSNLIRFVSYNGNGEVITEQEYTYDEDSNQTSYSFWHINPSGEEVSYTYKYKYDKDGNRTRETCYDSDGDKTEEGIYTYNKDGNQTSYSWWGLNRLGKKVSYTYKYKYDIDGNCTQETRYDDNGEVIEKTTYKYDKNGNCTQETFYDGDREFSYEYKYKDYEVIYLAVDPD